MTPIEIPMLPSGRWVRVTYAKDQPEYLPLPALRDETGRVVTCWRMTWRERLAILLHGTVYLTMLTFNKPLQPVKLGVSIDAQERAG